MQSLSDSDYRCLGDALADLARQAGRVIMEVYAGDFAVAAKADNSPVTVADERAEEIIATGLAQIAPGTGVIAEEAFARGDCGTPGDPFFLVDPLDGTREFINRNGEFTVNIALVERGTPSLGVVLAPAMGRGFVGMPGIGAFEDRGSGLVPIRARVPAGRPVAIASRSHRDAATDAYLRQLGIETAVSAGSSLKFCLLAAGDADIYPRFGPTCEWDTAAGHAVLLAAGGQMTGLDGGRFAYGKVAERFLNPGFLAWGAGPRPDLPDPAGAATARQAGR